MLDADGLMESAAARTGLTEFGDAPLRDGLEVLCKSLLAEARLTPAGVESTEAMLTKVLEERLKIEDWYHRHPAIDAQKIVAPVLVTGLPRSGTSALSQMMAQDPQMRSLRRWEASRPTPPPDAATQANDPRIAETQAMIDRRHAAAPEMKAMNPYDADDPSESWETHQYTFRSLHYAGVFRVPSYTEYALACDMVPTFRYSARVLKLLQSRCPPRQWNLKNPPELFHLPAFRKVFPDARIVWTHRDPVKTVPSVASLLVAVRRTATTGVDKPELGRSEFAFRQTMIARGMAFRDMPGAAVFDIYNRDVVRDPVGTMAALYARMGLEFTSAFDAALHRRIAERPKGRFGEHHYTAAEFGLDEAALRQAFAAYTERCAVPLDS